MLPICARDLAKIYKGGLAIYIWNRIIATDIETVIIDLREEAIRTLGIEYFHRVKKSGRDLFVTCFNYDAHDGIERTPSCSIDRESGIFHCFSCSISGSLPSLIAKVLRLSNQIDGYRWLLKRYSTPIKAERPLIPLDFSRKNKKIYLPESILDQYNYSHPYLTKRGLDDYTIELFDLGYCKETRSITIPIRDTKGRLVFIKKRPIKRDKFHKYHIEEGKDKRDLVFGLNIIRENIDRVKMIFLCEGEFDAMSWYVVKKYGAGLQGDRLFEEQLKELIKVAKGIPICLSLDNDLSGRSAQRKIINILYPYFPLYELNYPEARRSKDPNDLLINGMLDKVSISKVWIK